MLILTAQASRLLLNPEAQASRLLLNPGAQASRLLLVCAFWFLVVMVFPCCFAAPPDSLPTESKETDSAHTHSLQTDSVQADSVHIEAPAPASKVSNISNIPAQRDLYIVVEGSKLHYVEAGSGQAVVLLHGNDGTLQDLIK